MSVLVTGAATRIGAAIARRFARDGTFAYLHYLTSAIEAQELADELGNAVPISFDLIDRATAVSALAGLVERDSSLDTLVLSASRFEPDSPLAPDWQAFARMVEVNLATNVALAQAFLTAAPPGARRTVVVLLDQKLANPNPDFFSYTLTKAALQMAVTTMAMAAPPAARIFGVAPGLCALSHDQTDDEFSRAAVMNLLERRNTPQEVADAVHFMAQRLLTSGSILLCDSGQHLTPHQRDVMYLVRESA